MNDASDDLIAAANAACDRIAPVWPLDQSIAVNPWWKWVNQPFDECAARMALAHGARLYPEAHVFQEKWNNGTLDTESLRQAAADLNVSLSPADLLLALESPAELRRISLVSDLLDSCRDTFHQMSWKQEVVHQISQFCGAFFDEGQTQWHLNQGKSLYRTWHDTVAHERGIGLLMGEPRLHLLLRELPEDADTLVRETLARLGLTPEQAETYSHALLCSLLGWSSWCAWLGWQARLEGRENRQIFELLAIRLAWESVLFRLGEGYGIAAGWREACSDWPALLDHNRNVLRPLAVWQRAAERVYQNKLRHGLSNPPPATPEPGVSLQAAFCIDVRSEIFRRSLEAVSPQVQTLGFAGFFGLPIAYQALGTERKRPQLPGLLAPQLCVLDHCDNPDTVLHKRQEKLRLSELWRRFKSSGTSGFSYVESTGLLYGFKLLKESFKPSADAEHTPGLDAATAASLKPRLPPGLSLDARVDMAAAVLRGMSLTRGFAPLILLCGHGSRTSNNPHAAGLDCGACCGQSGEVNARALAALLNEPAVRSGLRGRGIDIPDATHFLPGLHVTTSDEILPFDTDEVPATHGFRLDQARSWLLRAGHRAREERIPALQEPDTPIARDRESVKRRAADWAQVRPEWALANNAAFIVAPRAFSRHLNLAGRSFLHEYHWEQDEGFRVLEQIMTAPMLVTHWINFQYYASTVDPERYGGGNKVLHNVVGGRIGVFEGNGGDLRIGLSRQSLHNGQRWIHEPLRLNVFLAAPLAAIEAIVAKHDIVRQLHAHHWLTLFHLDPDTRNTLPLSRG
jgi:uncharacterized protein YbcC (UPF0753/DUF2309 family)